jgi:hypothetical protein
MINYQVFSDVMTAAEKVATQLRIDKQQASTECDDQGFKLIRISKSSKTLVARFLIRNADCEIRILNRKRGTYIRLNVPEGLLTSTRNNT